MAIGITKAEILKAAQSMSQEERLNLIAEIAALVDESVAPLPSPKEVSTEEFLRLAQEFIERHSNLLRRLAE